jgi:ABC-type transporter Mla maintaining outer membrane lipid asymmetry permease subunit MlaE
MSSIKRFIATVVWVPLMAIVIVFAALSGLMVGATALMIPAVRWLARVGDAD